MSPGSSPGGPTSFADAVEIMVVGKRQQVVGQASPTKAITSTTAVWNAGTVGANHSLATEEECAGRFNSVISANLIYTLSKGGRPADDIARLGRVNEE